MASSIQKMKRMQSRKSHSWWWDSHISPKNSKWLEDNLEEMDQNVKRMLKLIEEDGDSFAKKAEMYYAKRPELVSNVEEFYRMYRALAERYDNLTGELRKSIPSDIQSQGSGISDNGSDLTSQLPTPKQKHSRRTSSHRAAGFEFFLGSGGGSSDLSRKASDTSSSSSDSESDSDSASFRDKILASPANGDGEVLQKRITELESEVLEVKEKLRVAEEENSDTLSQSAGHGSIEELLGRITWYDEELKVANERLRLSEVDFQRMRSEVVVEQGRVSELQQTIAGLEAILPESDVKIRELENELRVARNELKISEEEIGKLRLVIENNESECRKVNGLETQIIDQDHKIQTLEEELKIRNGELQLSQEEIARLKFELGKIETFTATVVNLQVQLESSKKEIEVKKLELESEKKRIVDLQDQVLRLEENVSDRDLEIRELNVAISVAEENFIVEKTQLNEKISLLSESQALLEADLKKWELKVQSLEEDIKRSEYEKMETQSLQAARENGMQSEIEQLKADMLERSNHVEMINKSFDALKLKYDMLFAERDQVHANVLTLKAEVSSKEDHIHQMDEHLHRLHMEHVELIAGSEAAHRLVEELKTRADTLEKEVEKQRTVILDGAEEKREAIRQLCFSLEHYRIGYHELRQAFLLHKRPAVCA